MFRPPAQNSSALRKSLRCTVKVKVGGLSRRDRLHDHVPRSGYAALIGPRNLETTPRVSGHTSDSQFGFITVEGNAGITGFFN